VRVEGGHRTQDPMMPNQASNCIGLTDLTDLTLIAPTASDMAAQAMKTIPKTKPWPATSGGAPRPIKTTPIKARAAPATPRAYA